MKVTKEQKCWINLFQDLRGLVKVFSILAITESLVLILKDYLHYKTIICHTVALVAQLIDCCIWKQNTLVFFGFVLNICRLLCFCAQISKSVTSSYALLHNGSCTFAYFFWIFWKVLLKKIGQILVCCIRKTSNANVGAWKLVLDLFYKFIKMTI